jgi:hypothetical protein
MKYVCCKGDLHAKEIAFHRSCVRSLLLDFALLSLVVCCCFRARLQRYNRQEGRETKEKMVTTKHPDASEKASGKHSNIQT